MTNPRPKPDKADSQFYCTSRYLAERLACAGYTGTPAQNIYYTNKPAWIFDLCPESARIVESYFVKMGKGVPIPVQRYLAAVTDPEEGSKQHG